LAELAPRLTPFVTTIDDHMSIAAFPERLAATLIGALGVCALLLAMIGVYAVISYGVSRRARELAIRMAIGATSPNVRRLVVRRGAAIASVGIVLGSAAAFACATALRNQLTALSGFDIVPYGFAVTLIGSAALLASWIPALRAGRIEPAEALRR
jgi:ABC-type antimicrobial peptide transport system permease subunit